MNSEMYSGALAERLMKCSKAVLSTFWKLLSLLNAVTMILQCTTADELARSEQCKARR